MFRRVKEYTVLALALALPLVACSGDSGMDADSGSVTLLLTDAPGDFHAAVVTISKVYLEGDGGEVLLSDTETTTDLLTLANDVQALAEDVVVSSGTYSQLRFVITGAYIEVENGDGSTSVYASPGYDQVPEDVEVAGTLQMPSYAQSGLKVNLPGGALEIAGDQKVVLVDFDVSESFGHQAGHSGMWVMSPVIHTSEIGLTASVLARLQLADSVELPTVNDTLVTLGDFSAKLTDAEAGEESLALTDEDEDGVFEAEFLYLIPGDYTVEFVGPDGVTFTLDIEQPVDVGVASGERAEVDAVVTSAAAS